MDLQPLPRPQSSIYTPSPSSQSFRTNLAQLVSPFRRVRPRVPFWHLAAHRIPTLWGLYRGLLKRANDDVVRNRMKELMRKKRHLTSPKQTIEALKLGYKFLDYFTLTQSNTSPHHAGVLARYSSLLTHRASALSWRHLIRKNLVPTSREYRLANDTHPPPIFTGGILRNSLFLPPMPRMKPQPVHISMIYRKRQKRREKQLDRVEYLKEMVQDMQHEATFESALMKELKSSNTVGREVEFEPVWCGEKGKVLREWTDPMWDAVKGIRDVLERDHVRKRTPPSPELIAITKAARRIKLRNKTRELSRERRGEVLQRTRRRARGGAPAHVWVKWSNERKYLETVARSSVSESGFVGLAKKKLGWKLKDENAWRREEGPLEGPERERVDELEREVKEEIEQRIRLEEQEERSR